MDIETLLNELESCGNPSKKWQLNVQLEHHENFQSWLKQKPTNEIWTLYLKYERYLEKFVKNIFLSIYGGKLVDALINAIDAESEDLTQLVTQVLQSAAAQAALMPVQILLIIRYCIDESQKQILVDLFNSFSAYERNQIILKMYIDNDNHQGELIGITDRLSPATRFLLANKNSNNLAENITLAIRALADNKLNIKIYKLYQLQLTNNQIQLTSEQKQLIELWKTLENNDTYKYLLQSIVDEAQKPTVITTIPRVHINSLRNNKLDLHYISSTPQKVEGVNSFLIKSKDENVVQDPVDRYLSSNQQQTPYSILNTAQNVYYISEITLGKGGEGRVKLAQNMLTQEWFALKIIEYPSYDTETAKIARDSANNLRSLNKDYLKDEVIISGRSKNKNFIKHYLVIEYAAGTSLQKILKNEELTFAQKLQYALNFVKAVNQFHKENLIVRDVKSNNAVATKNGNVTLVDLNNVCLETKSPNWIIATNGYKAPELKGKKSQNKKTDIYAVGATLGDIFAPKKNKQTGKNPTSAGELWPHVAEYFSDAHQPKDQVERTIWTLARMMLSSPASGRGDLKYFVKILKKIEIDSKNIDKLTHHISNIDNLKDLTQVYTRMIHDKKLHINGNLPALKKQFLKLAYLEAKKGKAADYRVIASDIQKVIESIKDKDYYHNLKDLLNEHKNLSWLKWGRGHTDTFLMFSKAASGCALATAELVRTGRNFARPAR